MQNILKKLVFLSILALASESFAETIYTDFFSDKALSGYDTVAFFSESRPVKGDKSHQLEHLGVTWYFSSAKNRALFEKNPDKYRPQYGGHCAWAVAANNAKAKGDPRHWKIVEDKLYLNYSAEVQQKWLQDIPGFIVIGDNNWPSLGAE